MSVHDYLRKFENILNTAEHQHILIARDAGDRSQVNTGIMIIRNTPESLHMLHQIKDLQNYPFVHNDQQMTLGNCPNQQCLHEQQAFNHLLENDIEF